MQLIRSLFVVLSVLPLPAQVISSVVGTNVTFPAGEVNAMAAPFGVLAGIVKDTKGNTYVSDHTLHMVFRISADRKVTILAGNGIAGYSGDGGPATLASMTFPFGLAVDGAGNVYVADAGNNRIRRINPDGTIVTIAGTGASGRGLDNILAVLSPINIPFGVAVGGDGTVYFSDTFNNRIRAIDRAGVVRTIAGSATAQGLGDGGPALQASLQFPYGLSLDVNGNLFVADANQNRIRKITAGGIISTVAGSGIATYGGDNGPALSAALRLPYQAAADPSGNLFIADYLNRRVRLVRPNGVMTTSAGTGQPDFSGDGGNAQSAGVSFPSGVFADGSLDYVFTDSSNGRVRRVVDGIITTVAGAGAAQFPSGTKAPFVSLLGPNGLAFDAAGNLYIAESQNGRVLKVSPEGSVTVAAGTAVSGYGGDGGPATQAKLFTPQNVAVDGNGNLYISDVNNDRIRKVTPGGIITTVAGTGAAGFNGDGVATQVPINHALGISVDPVGNLLIADIGNGRVRRLLLDGRIETIAGTGAACTPQPSACFTDGIPATSAVLDGVASVVTNGEGTYWISEINKHRVRKFTLGGPITTVAGTGTAGYAGDGGAGTAALLNTPRDLALDKNGNLYITDSLNHAIRVLTPEGVIRTVAGTGQAGYSGDGGSPLAATLNQPGGLTLAPNGDLYISDNGRIRVVTAQAPAVFAATPGRLTFEAASDAGTTAPQHVTIRSSTTGLPYAVAVPGASPWVRVSTASGALPAQLEIRADATGLAAGSYSSNVLVATPDGSPLAQIVPVTFNVSPAVPATLAVDRNLLNVVMQSGEQETLHSIGLRVTGSGSMNVTARLEKAEATPWLRAVVAEGSVSAAKSGALRVFVNPAGLAVNTYSAVIVVDGLASNRETPDEFRVRVNLAVTEPKQKFLLPQTVLSFQTSEGGVTPAAQDLLLLNTGTNAVNWSGVASTIAGGNWLRLTMTTGNVARPNVDFARIPVEVDPRGLRAGSYFGTLRFASSDNPGSPQSVSVQLTVLPAGTPLAPQLQPTSLVFTGARGESPGAQLTSVFNPSAQPVELTSIARTERGTWLQHVPTNAVMSPGRATPVMVQADFKGLDAGVHTGSIPFRFSDGSTQSISVTAIVSDGGSEGASPNSKATAPREADNCLAPPLRVTLVNRAATFPAVVNEALPLTVRIDDNCGRPVSSGKNGVTGVTAWIGRFSNGDAGAAMEAVPGGQFSKSFVFEKMPAGPATATGEIGALARLSDNQYVGGTLPVSVQLRTAAVAPPRVSTSVNSASFLENTPLAPGGFVTLFGERMTGGERRGAEGSTYPTTLANTRVLLGEKALPLQYVSADQINAQIPFDVEPNAQLALRIQRDDMSSVPTSFIVAKAQPAVFTSAQNGQGQAAAVNQSGTVNGADAPAPRGSFISLYCTGLGAVSPASPAGEMASSTVLSRTVSPVTATLGGRSASVQFAGLAPGFTGLYQVNLQIPDETEAGDAEVVISVDGQSSPPVTVAVQ